MSRANSRIGADKNNAATAYLAWRRFHRLGRGDEVLAFAGVEAVLFSGIPSDELRQRFSSAQAIGIASTARAHDPEWMAANLPAPFQYLHDLGAPLLHYKVCSTFDSSEQSGNIGKAIAIRPSIAIR